jgi:hypothetical protein
MIESKSLEGINWKVNDQKVINWKVNDWKVTELEVTE